MTFIDHIHPWSLGGDSTPENLRLLCRTHNQWRAEKTFSH
ncbi:MAG: HNH endonuclease [Deltaproteobacteria bacterium]|nr:HNH endonuclease [Deltaproteobacteria bacterium]